MARLTRFFDPFIGFLVGTVVLASLLPARGAWADRVDVLADIGIVLLFFIHGAKLSRRNLIDGGRNLRLQLAVLACTFLVFPVLGLALSSLPMLSASLATGFLFLALLPSTVQSSIALTAIARGNVAAAVCSATFSNFAGIFITPLLVGLLLGGAGELSIMASVQKIVLNLLLPFLAGHLLRPLVGDFIARHMAGAPSGAGEAPLPAAQR
ncbi:bile acid:sodium symporter [Novosphingobium decolorationis]|uniref:Bile acid:sodium symporter n=1 Tax=Novosphingobium decolorationis TaxID=2698673 RepID=A0ABX8E585_9SPHN|nr:bile acid:sodium symporter [Pseudomonadota bacterium]QVM84127.1 bile acid:sodium symporter [Novosphingobium decolorationis]